MGWSYYRQPGHTKADQLKYLVSELTRNPDTLAHSLRGKVLWSVISMSGPDRSEQRYISCTLLDYDESSRSWGWKHMDESMGPTYFNCPISYLKKAPVSMLPPEIRAKGSFSLKWRERVRLYHRNYSIGDRVTLDDGYAVPELTVVQLKPLVGVYCGHLYKVPRDGVVRVEPFDASGAAA